MELEEFVDALPFSAFNELRKTVIARHQRHSEEIALALEYITSQDVLIKSLNRKRPACEKVIAEKCNIPIELASKAVDRYLQMKEHFELRNGKVEKPFEK